MAKTRDFTRVIQDRLRADPILAEAIERESLNARIALQIYEARLAAGLTQEQLAQRIGSRQSVIARLEDADYEGHSLTMLRRIADALNCTLAVSFTTRRKSKKLVRK